MKGHFKRGQFLESFHTLGMRSAVKVNNSSLLTSSVTGPDDGVASPLPFVGFPLPHFRNFDRLARPGARGVRQA